MDPRPQPWQGCALPLSYFRIGAYILDGGGTQNRTGDTRIFSPLLYHLSYPALHSTFKMAGPTRLELATFGVTGRHSNQLSYDPAFYLQFRFQSSLATGVILYAKYSPVNWRRKFPRFQALLSRALASSLEWSIPWLIMISVWYR